MKNIIFFQVSLKCLLCQTLIQAAHFAQEIWQEKEAIGKIIHASTWRPNVDQG